MPRKKPVLGFKTQEEAKKAVQSVVDPFRKTDQEFKSQLVSDLIAQYHFGAKQWNARPTKFRWSVHQTWGFEHAFNAYFPDYGWREVSWNKAIKQWELNLNTLPGAIAAELRMHTGEILKAYRTEHPHCERAGCDKFSEDVDHVEPEFKVIAQTAIGLLSTAELQQIIDNYDWRTGEGLKIPEKCISSARLAHENAQLMAVCRPCHWENARERKRNQS